MLVRTLPLGIALANCYLVKTDDAVIVIDPAEAKDEIVEFLNSSDNKIILLTHCHFDHISGAKSLREKTGAKIAIHENDAGGLCDSELNAGNLFGIYVSPFTADITLKDVDKITLGSTQIDVLLTNGHTEGSVCYIINDCMFSGDTLFEGTVGRCDLPTGDYNKLLDSLDMLKNFSDKDYTVYSGHGNKTTLKKEIVYNPYFRRTF
ncbi:MAG: MBL fold metallo-hydrolase [Clostridia bacterium]|nr:MBL fold metallo-hydrolase [Clostridia bacterium]